MISAATVAAAAAAAAATGTSDPPVAGAGASDDVAGDGGEVEFDADQLEALSERPLEGPGDADFELEPNALESAGDAAPDTAAEHGEREFDLDLAPGDADADPLDALDDADIDSLAALSDDDAIAIADEPTPPEAVTHRRAAPAPGSGEDALFGARDSDLSIFGDADDEDLEP
jgi:hypothetical protein